ncbi:MAG: ester cyclase, partial [Vicinamibacterales bacterium]
HYPGVVHDYARGARMSVEENKALVRRYFDEIDRTGDESVVDQYVSADFVDHSPSPGCTPDLAGLKAAFRMFRTGSPGTHRIEDIVAEADKVVVRVTGQGVHSGELFGIPATHREFTATGITIFRVADGMIVERWVEIDMLGALQQLGVIPEDQTRV